jgi:hypothetical protein
MTSSNRARVTLFLFAWLVLCSTAQARKIRGQIIDWQGKSIDVIFNIPFKLLSSTPNYEKMQYRIVYYDAKGQKIVMKPHEAQEITFVHNNQEIRMLSHVNTIGAGSIFSNNTHIFLKLEIDGKLRLYSFFYTQNSGGMYSPATGGYSAGVAYSVENYILQKDNSGLVQPRGISFRKDMSVFFQDCPSVAKRIQERDLRKGDLEIIVKMYNDDCGW